MTHQPHPAAGPAPSSPSGPADGCAQEQDAPGRLHGTWTLVDYTRWIDAEVIGRPLGPDPVGQLVYQRDGRVCALLMRRERPWTSGRSFTDATDEERGAAALGFVGYAGRFVLCDGLVFHHVEMSLYVEHVGAVLVRRVSWSGPRLVLETEGRRTRSGRTLTDRLEWARSGR
ncbi:lipocalin-like domain-containing protein [Streptomyces viridosporus]|uniref:lipocalin-like domain-containing protein n=1 Tax=Streptomyces viridosporus TaxID=67581 RepID=UPI0036F7FF6B